jgi:protocatechuate 3,4-dioxygenase beta subunit/5-hydroxyisourate hydrolase-like protein (transthyretin family)
VRRGRSVALLAALAVALIAALGWLATTWHSAADEPPAPRATPVAQAEAPAPPLPAVADAELLAAPPAEIEPESPPPPAPPPQTDEALGIPEDDGAEDLRVVVVDGQALPVPDARVRVWPDQESCQADETALQDLVTDSRGRATVAMPGSNSVLLAERDDVGSSGMWRRNSVSSLRNLDGEAPIPLRPRSTVRVLVLEADDRPAAGVTVHFWRSGGGMTAIPRAPPDRVTDAQGRVECRFDAEANLAMRAQDGERRTLEERVLSGAGTEHDVTLRFPGNWSISGTVVDATERPVAGALVRLWLEFPGYDIEAGETPKENCYLDEAQSTEDGGFRFAVPRLASYTLLASVDERPASDALSVLVDELHPQPHVTLTMPEPSAIAGRLRTEAGDPLPAVTISAEAGLVFYPLAALYTPTRQDRFGRAETTTDVDGRFRIEDLHPRGVYQLVCAPDAEHPKRRVTRKDVPAGTFDLDWVVTDSDLVRGVVSGVVLSADDGHPIESFTVALVERGERSYRQFDTQFSDPGGHFTFASLKLGTSYSLKVSAEGWSGAEVPWWTSVETPHEVVVRLERPGTLEVEVRDALGTLAPLVQVAVLVQSDLPPLSWRYPLSTDDAGRVRFEALDAGLYHVTATRGESRAEADVTVAGGVVTRARLDLRQP